MCVEKAHPSPRVKRRRNNRPRNGGGNSGAMTAAKSERRLGMKGKLAEAKVHEKGQDIIYVVQTGVTPPTTAQTLGQYFVNPLTLLSGTRIASLSTLYQKFRFTKFKLVYEPELSVTFSGRVWAAYFANPNDELAGTGTRMLQQLTNLKYMKLIPVATTGKVSERSFSVPPAAMVNAPGQKYITDIENSTEYFDCYQGMLMFGCDGPLVASTTYGTWKLEWEVEFYDPIANPADNAAVVQYQMSADAGQTKPFGSSGTPLFGNSSVCQITFASTQNNIIPGDEGNYSLIAFYPDPSGGAGLTSSSTIVAVGDITIVSSDVAYEYAQTGKRWFINFVCTAQNPSSPSYIALADAAGTHPSTPCVVTIIKYRPLVPMPKGVRQRAAAREREANLLARVAQAERVLALLPTPTVTLGQDGIVGAPYPTTRLAPRAGEPVLEEDSVATTTDGGNSPPKTTTTHTVVSQILPIDTFVLDPAAQQPKWKLKKKKEQIREQVSRILETSDEDAD